MRSKTKEVLSSEPTLLMQMRRQRTLIFMSLPFVVHIIIFAYIPIWGWSMAFQNFAPGRSFFEQEWVGFSHFATLFGNVRFWQALRNTLGQSIIGIVFNFVSAIGLAILLNELRVQVVKRSIQTISYLPYFVSWVVAANIVFTMLSAEGPINTILVKVGILDTPMLFLGKGELFWWLMGIVGVWKEVGWNAIIYLAAISMINPELYESAEIDGANRFQKMKHITLPGIMPTVIVLLIISTGYILSAGFEKQYLLMNAMNAEWAENIDIFTLKMGIAQGQFSFATASGIFKSVVGVSLVMAANKLAKHFGQPGLI